MGNQNKKRLSQIQQLKHDIISPLTTIRGQLDLILLKEKGLTDSGYERIRKVIVSCDQITALLDSIESKGEVP